MFYIVNLAEDVVTTVKTRPTISQAALLAAEMVTEQSDPINPPTVHQIVRDFVEGNNFFGNGWSVQILKAE